MKVRGQLERRLLLWSGLAGCGRVSGIQRSTCGLGKLVGVTGVVVAGFEELAVPEEALPGSQSVGRARGDQRNGCRNKAGAGVGERRKAGKTFIAAVRAGSKPEVVGS